MNLKEKVIKTIKKYSMLQQGDNVLIGLSGGPDSVCMTIILDELKKDFNLSLNAVYVDHGLRPEEVIREKEFCSKFCEDLGIGFISKAIDVDRYAKDKKSNRHEAARELRYKVFDEVSINKGSSKIALGHTADDQAETLLMRLLRGAGRRGLSGMPPKRSLKFGVRSAELGNNKSIFIIRPLIEVQRQEIEEFLAEHLLPVTCLPVRQARDVSQPYMTDSSNLKTEYLRNWLRMEVIPLLKKDNPSVTESINRTAEILRDEDEYLEIATTKTMMRLITRKTDRSIELFLMPLMNIDKAILRRILRRALGEIDAERGIELVHIDDIIRLVNENKSGDMIDLPKGIRAVKSYSTLLITGEHTTSLKTQNIDVPGELVLKEAGIVLKAEISDKQYRKPDNRDTAVFDFKSIKSPLEIRMRKKGDYFYPSGFGRKKKLQDFFVDEKVPRDERNSVPLVVSGNDIIWVAGFRADERFSTTVKTDKFLRLIISRKISDERKTS